MGAMSYLFPNWLEGADDVVINKETKPMKRLSIICAVAVVACGMCLTVSAEDGYIESKGNSGVCLGHCAGPNTKLEVDFQLTEVEYGVPYDLTEHGGGFNKYIER